MKQTVTVASPSRKVSSTRGINLIASKSANQYLLQHFLLQQAKATVFQSKLNFVLSSLYFSIC